MDLPAHVRIREVGPRDGFQNEPELIPTEEKLRLIELLGRSGIQRLEVMSFVRAGIDLAALIEASRGAQRVLGRRLESHSLAAGPIRWKRA